MQQGRTLEGGGDKHDTPYHELTVTETHIICAIVGLFASNLSLELIPPNQFRRVAHW